MVVTTLQDFLDNNKEFDGHVLALAECGGVVYYGPCSTFPFFTRYFPVVGASKRVVTVNAFWVSARNEGEGK